MQVTSEQADLITRIIGYYIMMLVIVLFLCIFCLGNYFTSLFNQLSDFVSNLLERNVGRGTKSEING